MARSHSSRPLTSCLTETDTVAWTTGDYCTPVPHSFPP